MHPILHSTKVSTFVLSVKVGYWVIAIIVPVVCDDTNINVAHELLAEHVGAVIEVNCCFLKVRGAVIPVVFRVDVLTEFILN